MRFVFGSCLVDLSAAASYTVCNCMYDGVQDNSMGKRCALGTYSSCRLMPYVNHPSSTAQVLS